MTKEQILQKHFTAEFGHDGHGKFMQYILDAMEEYSQQQVKNLNIPAVSNRRELYFAFMKEYNSLMGESEHQILKEEVEVLLAKYSC